MSITPTRKPERFFEYHFSSEYGRKLNGNRSHYSNVLRKPITCEADEAIFCRVSDCIIPNTSHDIDENNNLIEIVIDEGAGEGSFYATLPSGRYDLISLRPVLQASLNEATVGRVTWAVTIVEGRLKYDATPDVGHSLITLAFRFLVYYLAPTVVQGDALQEHISLQSYKILGFEPDVFEFQFTPPLLAGTVTSATSPNLSSVIKDHAYFIRTNIGTPNVYSTSDTGAHGLLKKIPMRIATDNIEYNNFSNDNFYVKLDSRHISYIEFLLTDERQQYINLQGVDWEHTIQFKIAQE